MGYETELLKWLSLKKERDILIDSKGKIRLKEVNKNLKDHETYMKEQGFEFNLTELNIPNGEKYEL